jgi:membrane protein involved in colicin uptake
MDPIDAFRKLKKKLSDIIEDMNKLENYIIVKAAEAASAAAEASSAAAEAEASAAEAAEAAAETVPAAASEEATAEAPAAEASAAEAETVPAAAEAAAAEASAEAAAAPAEAAAAPAAAEAAEEVEIRNCKWCSNPFSPSDFDKSSERRGVPPRRRCYNQGCSINKQTHSY